MSDRPNPPLESIPLIPEGYRRRKSLIVCRALIYGALVLALKLSRCGEGVSDNIIEEPAKKTAEAKPEKPRNPALQFLGTWTVSPKQTMPPGMAVERGVVQMTIQSWTPENKTFPPKERPWKNGKKMELLMPVKWKLIANTPSVGNVRLEREVLIGIYKLPEGGYFLGLGPNAGSRIQILRGDLQMEMPVDKLSPFRWLTFNRIK